MSLWDKKLINDNAFSYVLTTNLMSLKVLGEALGHVDGEDGVLVKVYDDIQTELK